MKTCLNFEEVLIARSQNRPLCRSETDMHSAMDLMEITKEFEALNNHSMVSSSLLKELQDKHQKFVILFQELPRVNEILKSTKADLTRRIKEINGDNLDHPEIDDCALQRERDKLMKQREYIAGNLTIFIKDILDLEMKLAHILQGSHEELVVVFIAIIMEDLPAWKHKQQLSCNGAPLNEACIRSIQKRCECLANLISKILQDTIKFKGIHHDWHESLKLKKICPDVNDYTTLIETLQCELQQLLMEVVYRSFIVDHQPPQVLRKDIKFEAAVSILVGKAVNAPTFLPKVTAYLISEEEAQKFHTGQEITTCGDLKNNQATVELLQCGTLTAKFKNLAIQNVVRGTRQPRQRITEEKFCLLFETQIKIGNLEKPLKVLSVPVIFNSNVSQECDSLATIMWDHQFSAMDRSPFHVPNSVPWPEMANLLNVKFKAETGRGLSEDNLRYIGSKIFGHLDDYSDEIITMDMFCKVNMTGCSFTFWDWFFCLIRLTKDHLQGPWKDGYVAGFISKSEAEKCLQPAGNGTFLCRFSDTKLGGVSIVYHRRNKNSTSDVSHREPYVSTDFKRLSFPELIMNEKKWHHLYLDKPKDKVFCKYIDIENARIDSQDKSPYEKFIWVIKGL